MTQVIAPVGDFTGTSAGVEFVDGVAETDNPTALAYFQRHGYEVKAAAKPSEVKPAKKAAAKPSEK